MDPRLETGSPVVRTRPDRCPGALRPWPADDGLLVRLRVPGGQVRSDSVTSLLDVADTYGDGRIHVTSRANLQLRGLPGEAGQLPGDVLAAIEATGLLPSRTHDVVRNVLASPQTGRAGGRVDLRPLIRDLDSALLRDPQLGRLPGRFLFVLDDGRGDLVDRSCDLGLVALDATLAQVRVGAGWGPVVALADAVPVLTGLARQFLAARGEGPGARWHVSELAEPLVPAQEPHTNLPPGARATSEQTRRPTPLPYGWVPGGRHVALAQGLDRPTWVSLRAAEEIVVTPWRGLLLPEEAS